MREVNTIEELEALPKLAVILIGLEDDELPGALAAQKDDQWYVPGEPFGKSSFLLVKDIEHSGVKFTATVVYEGVTPEQSQAIVDTARGRG